MNEKLQNNSISASKNRLNSGIFRTFAAVIVNIDDMVREVCYQVAGHPFCISAEEKTFTLMQNYAPFSTTAKENVTFSLHIVKGEITNFIEDIRQDDGEGQVIISGHTEDGTPVFQFRWLRQTAGWFLCKKDYGSVDFS